MTVLGDSGTWDSVAGRRSRSSWTRHARSCLWRSGGLAMALRCGLHLEVSPSQPPARPDSLESHRGGADDAALWRRPRAISAGGDHSRGDDPSTAAVGLVLTGADRPLASRFLL